MTSNRFPYTYIACPCSETSRQHLIPPKRYSRESALEDVDLEVVEETTFNPHHPRSNFSLFPPEHLLYCEDCHTIKCPRCITTEIICWFCPSCLFETPSSTVRSEGNRCARNCFNCPVCESQMITTNVGEKKEGGGPWILSCDYCLWNTLEIGVSFEKPTNLRAQLERIENGGGERRPSRAVIEGDRKSSLAREPFSPNSEGSRESDPTTITPQISTDPASHFTALRSFYKDQLASSSASTAEGLTNASADLYSSPSSLARIMSLYSSSLGTSSSATLKKASQKPTPMREALTAAEGLTLTSSEPPESSFESYIFTPTPAQLLSQNPNSLGHPTARHVRLLRPMPTLLRTKLNKRCKTCKHILVRPEFKPTSTRYRIKLIALNCIPLISLRPLLSAPPGVAPNIKPTSAATFTAEGGDVLLQPGKASQWILTLRNHLFDPVSVTLGTPSIGPGRRSDRVTILCPVFEVGANGEVWDDALLKGKEDGGGKQSGKKDDTGVGNAGGEQIAGKVYDRGRNWTSVVLEVVPGFGVAAGGGRSSDEAVAGAVEGEGGEDADVLEIPIRVRLEWTVSDLDATGGEEKEKARPKKSEKVLEDGAGDGDEDGRKRELAYWMVLGVGRVGIV